MTKTTNYQLPKWEKTDRVQMKDFNDMTATLDAALKANADAITAETTARIAGDVACPVVKLVDYVNPRAAAQINLSTTGFSLSDFVELWVYADLEPSDEKCRLRLNNISANSYRQSDSYQTYLLDLGGPKWSAVRHFRLYHTGQYFIATNFSTYMNVGMVERDHYSLLNTVVEPQNFKSINFCTDSGTFAAGGHIRLYGLRA